MTTQMLIKLEYSTKEKLNLLAKRDGESVNSVVRQLINEYIKRRDISVYIEELWDNISVTLKRKDTKTSDIDKAIKSVRKSRQ